MNIVVCAPGKTYSGNFLSCWTAFLSQALMAGHNIFFSQTYNPNIYHSRNLCLGGDLRRGKDQKPFNGNIKYDYLLWIDSDIIFSYEKFQALLDRNVDICSGLYYMENGRLATVKNWDTERLIKNGTMDFCYLHELNPTNNEDLVEVSYTGMGFMLIKYGVLESLDYPWFKPLNINIGNIHDFTTEDVQFCLSAQQHGYKIYVDPMVVLGHEKTHII